MSRISGLSEPFQWVGSSGALIWKPPWSAALFNKRPLVLVALQPQILCLALKSPAYIIDLLSGNQLSHVVLLNIAFGLL